MEASAFLTALLIMISAIAIFRVPIFAWFADFRTGRELRPALTRPFVRDVAILAEQLVMYDLTADGKWDASREQAAPFFPDRIAEIAERPGEPDCEVRRRRVEWGAQLRKQRDATVVEFSDPGIGTEKAAVVMMWQRGLGDLPTIVVAFRGSKGATDWIFTNTAFVNPLRKMIRLDDAVYAACPNGPSESRHCHAESDAPSGAVAVPLSVWRAYAGEDTDGSRTYDSPRGSIRRAVERLLRQVSVPLGL